MLNLTREFSTLHEFSSRVPVISWPPGGIPSFPKVHDFLDMNKMKLSEMRDFLLSIDLEAKWNKLQAIAINLVNDINLKAGSTIISYVTLGGKN